MLSESITKNGGGENYAMVVTTDKDMLQLINKSVSVYRPGKDVIVSPLNFYEQTGVTQEAYIGYRALVGDTSDNIFGVQGIGEKTAKNLMDQYGNIDNVLGAKGDDKAKLLKSKRTARIFEPEGLNRLGINNKIMNFKYVPYDQEVEDLVHKALGIYMGPEEEAPLDPAFDTKAFRAFCMRWQFLSILTNYMPFVTPFFGLGDEE
ncbi:DNA polymerase I, thermostable [compost metagenome]